LSTAEVGALHTSAINGLPLGAAPAEGAPIPVLKMNLRGQALAISSDGGIFPAKGGLSLTTADGLTTTEKVVRTSFIGGSLIPNVTGYISLWRSSSSSSGSVSWRYLFTYADGTTATTSARTVTSSSGTSSADAAYTDANPNPTKPVVSISLLAYLSGSYVSSYTGTFFGMLGSERQVVNWNRAPDRFGLAQRALTSTGTGRIELLDHSTYFSPGQKSATYNFWLRMDALASTRTIFTHNRSSSGDLVMSIDASGNLVLAGPANASFASPIEVGKWHMVTLVGSYSPSTITLFVDGEEVGNVPASAYPYGQHANGSADPSYFSDMTIGDSSNGFVGAIDEVSFYNGVLTPTEVRTIYNREAPQSIYHTVTQGVVDPSVSPQLVQMPAAGGSALVDLVIAQNVNWTVSTGDAWITVTSPGTGAGSDTVALDVAANPTVYERQGEIDVAGKTVTVVQAGLNATVTHDELVFGTDGGSGWIDVSPEGNGQWNAVSDVSWLTVAIGDTGAGAGSVFIVADPYTNTSSSRTGSVTVAGQKVYVTQRGYTLSINPQVAQIGSNAGAGEFGVAAPISAVWEAIATQPWITIMGGTNGIGNGTIYYSVAQNDTGATRTGRILVSGQEYTITQVTSLLLATASDGNGTVSGAGSFSTNAVATLTATPDAGSVFSHWSGDAVGSANPLNLNMDSSKSVTAHFIPATAADSLAAAAVQAVIDDPNPLGLFTADQMRGLALGRPVLTKDPVTGKMSLDLALKRSTDLTGWAPYTLAPEDVDVVEGGLNVEITPEGNAAFYRIETNGD
ncbi:MAG: hypothetical protein KDN05_14720, partial [Verrucomicrobiae bacterium]|nr:hypothetical protein [Verrucomicrobiae bacterium]